MSEIKPTDNDKAYLAALIDCSARIRIRHARRSDGRKKSEFIFSLTRIPAAVALWIQQRFPPEGLRTGPRGYRVTYVTRSASAILAETFPFLVLKREHAKLVWRYARTLSAHAKKVDLRRWHERDEIARELDALLEVKA